MSRVLVAQQPYKLSEGATKWSAVFQYKPRAQLGWHAQSAAMGVVESREDVAVSLRQTRRFRSPFDTFSQVRDLLAVHHAHRYALSVPPDR